MYVYSITITLVFLIVLLVSVFIISKFKRRLFAFENDKRIISQEQELVLSFFHRIGEAFTEALDLQELLKLIIDFSRQTTKAKAGAIFLVEENSLRAHIVDGIFPPLYSSTITSIEKISSKVKYLNDNLKKEKIPIGTGIIGKVAKERKSILVTDVENNSDIPKTNIDFIQIKTLMAVPLEFKDEVIGVMVAVNKLDENSFTENDLSLFESLADQAAISINNAHLYKNISAKERIDRELKIAKEIQNLLLPKAFPELKSIDIAAFSDPALEVGGDYFDFIPLSQEQLGIVIADVSGKGIPASLMMVMYRSILRIISQSSNSPSKILESVNDHIFSDMKYDMFISSTFGIMDLSKGEFISSRAGHEPLIYFNKKDKKLTLIKSKGIAIGIDKGALFKNTIEDHHISLKKGDILVLYTDGITEAIDSKNTEFGIENLLNTISISANLSAFEIANNIKERIKRFTNTIPQRDDLTAIVIKAL
ncbi:GAF domain-containing SpoIIE family protein phosphatase [Chlamydiota bacterium]